MKLYFHSLKLFCKTRTVIVPYILLLILDNVLMFRLYQAFVTANSDPQAVGHADPFYYFHDTAVICYLIFSFFIYISFEFMRKVRAEYLEEVLTARGSRGALVYAQQLLALCTAALLHAFNMFVYPLLGLVSLNSPSRFRGEIVQMVCVDVFLLSLASLGLGFVISGLRKRFTGYVVMLGIIFMVLPNMQSFFADWQREFHIPIYVFRDLIYLIPPDFSASPDSLYGMPLEWYRCAGMLFWILACVLLCGKMAFRFRRAAKRVFCICLAAAMAFMGYEAADKGSVLLMRNHPQSGIEEAVNYDRDDVSRERRAGFSVSRYEMEFSMKKQLTADVTLTIQSGDVLPEYIFTLYHGYKISSVTDEAGNEYSFEQQGDYVTVDNPERLAPGTMKFHYKGCSPLFYSNSKACFLPGFFPYYPRAGYRPVYEDRRIVNTADPRAVYRVKVFGDHPVVSNLTEQDGVLVGETDNVMLLYGYADTTEENGNTIVYYPLQVDSLDFARYYCGDLRSEWEELGEFLDYEDELGIEGKMIITIPDSLAFNSTMCDYYECGDYILVNGTGARDPYDIWEGRIPAVGKEEMKEVFFWIRPGRDLDPEDVPLYKDQSWVDEYDGTYELHDEIILKMKELGVQYVAGKIFHYLREESSVDALTFVKHIE